jgi:hypothetical protein
MILIQSTTTTKTREHSNQKQEDQRQEKKEENFQRKLSRQGGRRYCRKDRAPRQGSGMFSFKTFAHSWASLDLFHNKVVQQY